MWIGDSLIEAARTALDFAGEMSGDAWKVMQCFLCGHRTGLAAIISRGERDVVGIGILGISPNGLQRDLASAFVATWEVHAMRSSREDGLATNRFVNGHQKHAFAHLRYAEVHSVQQRVAAAVSETSQRLARLFCNVVAAVVENVGHVLHQDRERLEFAHIVQVSQIEVSPRIKLERFWMLGNLSKLCASDTSERLTGRAANDHIDGFGRIALKAEFLQQIAWFAFRDVTSLRVMRALDRGCPPKEVLGMRSGRVGVELDGADKCESSPMETQRDSAAASEEIKDAYGASTAQSGSLFQHGGERLHGARFSRCW